LIKLCIFLCRFVMFVSILARWLYSCDTFRVKWFPLQRSDWRVIYCNGFIVCISNM